MNPNSEEGDAGNSAALKSPIEPEGSSNQQGSSTRYKRAVSGPAKAIVTRLIRDATEISVELDTAQASLLDPGFVASDELADTTADIIKQAGTILEKLESTDKTIRDRFEAHADDDDVPGDAEQLMLGVITYFHKSGDALIEELRTKIAELHQLFVKTFPAFEDIVVLPRTPEEVNIFQEIPPRPEEDESDIPLHEQPPLVSPTPINDQQPPEQKQKVAKSTELLAAKQKEIEENNEIELLKLQIAEFQRAAEKAALLKQLEAHKITSSPAATEEKPISPPYNTAEAAVPAKSNAVEVVPPVAPLEKEDIGTDLTHSQNQVRPTAADTLLLNLTSVFGSHRNQSAEILKAVQQLPDALSKSVRNEFEAMQSAMRSTEDDIEDEQEYEAIPSLKQTRHTREVRIDNLVKLLTHFDGTADYEIFRAQFKSTIMDHEGIEPSFQLLTLTSLLEGEARACIRTKATPALSLKATLEALENIYGNDNREHVLREKLQKLPFHQSDPRRMKIDLASHTKIIDSLEDQGCSTDDMRTVWELAAKLPPRMYPEMAKYIANHGNRIPMARAIKQMNILIETYETEKIISAHKPKTAINEIPESYAVINYAAGQKDTRPPQPKSDAPLAYDPSSFLPTFLDPITNETLEGYYKPGPGPQVDALERTLPYDSSFERCSACGGPHRAIRCTKSSSEFRKLLAKRQRCAICTGRHPITACKNTNRCIYCSGLHHTGGCTKKEFYRDPANFPEELKNRATFFRPQKGNKRQ
uniref:CCHC-type domain-containing protein n=1 Tax=Caenorhabditis tropicalis TaxID=1561998 RepID=A0A1I7SYW3_9PELO